jgi:hypothetical protein
MCLLETNVVSDFLKAQTGMADRNVKAWTDGVAASSLFLSAISILELETGILLMERRDVQQRRFRGGACGTDFQCLARIQLLRLQWFEPCELYFIVASYLRNRNRLWLCGPIMIFELIHRSTAGGFPRCRSAGRAYPLANTAGGYSRNIALHCPSD